MSATDGTRVAVETERTGHQMLVSIAQLLEELLAQTRHVRAAVESASSGTHSSVEIKTSTRGVDVTTKAYEGSDITIAGDAAMAEFVRVTAAMNGPKAPAP
jgi:hypothetical protein